MKQTILRFPRIRWNAIAICVMALTFNTTAQSAQPPATEPATTTFEPLAGAKAPVGRQMVIGITPTPPKIDGLHADACWKNISATRFLKADGSGKPRAASTVAASYDADNLYLLFYAMRPKSEIGHKSPGPTGRDDPALFKSDAIEIFLQPNGPGTTYYQIAADTAGGIYDLTHDAQGRNPNMAWNGANIRVAGRSNTHGYFIEMAIPFSDLGVSSPKPGDSWRVNFCRNVLSTKELSCWSPSGRVFNSPSQFGVLVFGDPSTAAKADQPKANKDHTLVGQLVRTDGGPAAYVMIRADNARTRSDADGRFKLTGLSDGRQILSIVSPRYHPLVGRIDVKHTQEVVAPISLTPIDPYLPRFQGPIGSAAVAWLNASIDEPFDMTAVNRPTGDALAQRMSLLAAPGQFLSRAVAIFANRDLPEPTVSISLTGKDGKPLKAESQVRWVQRALQRVFIHRPREDSAFNWRFLWDAPQSPVVRGQVRMLVLTLHLSDDTPAGTCHGTLNLASSGQTVASLPLELKVPAFHLARTDRRLGLYYPAHFDRWTAQDLDDIRAHGGSLLVTRAVTPDLNRNQNDEIEVNTDTMRRALEMLRTHGFAPPYLVHLPSGMMRRLAHRGIKSGDSRLTGAQAMDHLAHAVMDAVKTVQTALGSPSFVLLWDDEIFNKAKLPNWMAVAKAIRPLTRDPIFVTMHNSPRHAEQLARSMKAVDPYLDIRCYNGRAMDEWLAAGHQWSELGRELSASGDTGWTYYNDVDIHFTPEMQRLTCGYWLWRSPLTANIPWVYRALKPNENPFDTLSNDNMTMGFAFPHPDPNRHELVSTLDWEAFREGYNDLCYLATLQAAIQKAGTRHPAVAAAQRWLDQVRSTGPQTAAGQANLLNAEDYLQRRREMVKWIESLGFQN